MDIGLNDDERALLTWLHNNVNGYGEEYVLEVDVDSLGFDAPRHRKAVSYLEGLGFVGMKKDDDGAGVTKQVWLTAQGENHYRQYAPKELPPGSIGRM